MGKNRITIYDIAAVAKVSPATVSRVLNKRDKVDYATRNKVLSLCKQYGYIPLSKGKCRNKVIGIVLRQENYSISVISEYLASILQGAMSFCQQNSIVLSILPENIYSVDCAESFVEQMRISGIDAVIFVNPAKKVDMEGIVRLDFPCISIGANYSNESFSFISLDNELGVRLALEHLHYQGAEEIGFVTVNNNDCDTENRLDAFKKVTSEINQEKSNIIVISLKDGNYRHAAYSYFKKYFNKDKPLEAYFCLNDNIAIGLMDALAVCGYSVPEDVLVVGHDNYEISSLCRPLLSTIFNPTFQMGYMSCANLKDNMNGYKSVLRQVLKPILVQRDSSHKI